MNYEKLKKIILENRISSNEEQIAKMDEVFEIVKDMSPNDSIELSVLAITGNYDEDHVIEQFMYLIEDKIFEDTDFSIKCFIYKLCDIDLINLDFPMSILRLILNRDNLFNSLINNDFENLQSKKSIFKLIDFIVNDCEVTIKENNPWDDIFEERKKLDRVKLFKQKLER